MDIYITSHQTNFGVPILPIKRVELFSPDEWEEFIEEWLDLKRSDYKEVDRPAGAGDKGRDVVAYKTDIKDQNYNWDCYQCKHYDKALIPTQIYKEIGKILYYTHKKEYPIPNAYYFVAPKGCGTSLSKLLQNADELKAAIIKNWAQYCEEDITVGKIKLEGELKEHVENFNYSIFNKLPIKAVIEEHSKHPNHRIRFGGGLPARPILQDYEVPKEVQSGEAVYIAQLLLAYGSDCSQTFLKVDNLPKDSSYLKHLEKSRINFHHAEQLRNFSRDNLPLGLFEDLQSQILDGVENVLDEEHKSGFKKVRAVENSASAIALGGNALIEVLRIKDRHGICHQLTNDGRIVWTIC